MTLLALLVTLLPATVLAQVGGPCSYDSHPGTVSFVSVEPVPHSTQVLNRTPYQPYRALFVFDPATPVPGQLYQVGRTHELTLGGGQPPGPAFLKKYGIRPGARFKAELHIIRTGTCTPTVFTFHGIDVHDRFELK